jgi:hypothetical protein
MRLFPVWQGRRGGDCDGAGGATGAWPEGAGDWIAGVGGVLGRRRIAEPRHGGLVTGRCARGRRSGGLAGDLRRGGSAVRCRARTRSRALVARRGGAGHILGVNGGAGRRQLPRPWLFRPVGLPALDVPGRHGWPGRQDMAGRCGYIRVVADVPGDPFSELPDPVRQLLAQPPKSAGRVVASLATGWSHARGRRQPAIHGQVGGCQISGSICTDG